MRLHRIAMIFDESGHPAGATVTLDYDSPFARHLPVEVGPFDGAHAVLDDCIRRVDIQLSLWENSE